MATEIEHKYKVISPGYKEMADSSYKIIQGYLSRVPERTVRVRVSGDKGFLTVKGKNHGDTRAEFEYEIPLNDALSMLNLCEDDIIEKERWIVNFEDFKWEIDEFMGVLKGLVVAEIELPESIYSYPLPPFVGKEVTHDPRWFNSNIFKFKEELLSEEGID